MDLNKLKKAELVQIILRKDDVEKNLRNDLKGMEESLLKKKEEINVLEENNNTLCDNIKSLKVECDLNAANVHVANNTISRLRRRNYIWFTTSLLAILGLVVSLIF